MCAQVTTSNVAQLVNNNNVEDNKQAPSTYKGRRGQLCGNHSAKPWRIQGGPSIFGGSQR